MLCLRQKFAAATITEVYAPTYLVEKILVMDAPTGFPALPAAPRSFLAYDEACAGHQGSRLDEESPARIRGIFSALSAANLIVQPLSPSRRSSGPSPAAGIKFVPVVGRAATRDELLLTHTAAHIDAVELGSGNTTVCCCKEFFYIPCHFFSY